MKKYQDHYFKKAKQEQYPARSVYKLREMDKRFGLLGKGDAVLDLGACPGSWTQYAAEKVGERGRVLGVDLNPAGIAFPGNVTYLVGDALEPSGEVLAAYQELGPFDAVISDMAPKTTGIKFTDQARSAELCFAALDVARKHLKVDGVFVAKIFEGPDAKPFEMDVRKSFGTVKRFKPKSSRSESKEIFVVGMGFTPPAPDDANET